MAWTLTINVADVNGSPVTNGTWWLTLWKGVGTPQDTTPEVFRSEIIKTTIPDGTSNIDVRLRHSSFNDCVVVLVLEKTSNSWQWVGPAAQVSQSGTSISVNAVLRRLRAAPQVEVDDKTIQDLTAQAAAAKNKQLQSWTASRKKDSPPFFVDLKSANGALVTKSKFDPQLGFTGGDMLFFSTPAAKPSLHLVSPDPLGDATQSGWGRFSTITRDADPAHYGVFALLEYGEVSPLVASAPRFLVACWIPYSLLKTKTDTADFIVWFTPTTSPEFYPGDEYPFRKAYPYQIWAGGSAPDFFFVQRYILLPCLHLTRADGEPTSHYLTYLTAAAGKSSVVVAPISPAASRYGYEAFLSQSGLMRLVNELCMQIALYRQDKPGQYQSPPKVGKIAVAGLSAGVQRSQAVIVNSSAIHPYSDGHWQGDAGQFRKAWTEFWSFDAAFLDLKDKDGNVQVSGSQQFRNFLNTSAGWVGQQDGRHLRIYKTQFTAGANKGPQWDPRLEDEKTAPVFARMLKRAGSLQVQESKKPWALSLADSRRQWQCISLSEEYMRDPTGTTGLPEIPIGLDEFKKQNPKASPGDYKFYHDAVPRMFFGHALLTSGLT